MHTVDSFELDRLACSATNGNYRSSITYTGVLCGEGVAANKDRTLTHRLQMNEDEANITKKKKRNKTNATEYKKIKSSPYTLIPKMYSKMKSVKRRWEKKLNQESTATEKIRSKKKNIIKKRTN